MTRVKIITFLTKGCILVIVIVSKQHGDKTVCWIFLLSIVVNVSVYIYCSWCFSVYLLHLLFHCIFIVVTVGLHIYCIWWSTVYCRLMLSCTFIVVDVSLHICCTTSFRFPCNSSFFATFVCNEIYWQDLACVHNF